MGSGFDSLSPSKMKVFTGRSNPELAQGISDYLGIPLGKIDIQEFSDGEIWVAFEENIRNEDVFIIQSTNSPTDNIMELLLMLDAARRASAKNVIAVIPYLGYGRQDRKDQPRVPISARLVLDLITAVGVKRIITMDLHSPQIQGFVNVPFDHLYSRIVLLDRLRAMNLSEENGVCGTLNVDSVFWVVDPLDGTVNYSEGIPFCCVSIALMNSQQPYLGVIYDFIHDEIFTGIVGKGAWLNNLPISTSNISSIKDATLATGFPVNTDFTDEILFPFVKQIQTYKKVRLLRQSHL